MAPHSTKVPFKVINLRTLENRLPQLMGKMREVKRKTHRQSKMKEISG